MIVLDMGQLFVTTEKHVQGDLVSAEGDVSYSHGSTSTLMYDVIGVQFSHVLGLIKMKP